MSLAKLAISLFALLIVSASQHHEFAPAVEILCSGFLPPNDMKIPVSEISVLTVNQTDFNTVIDKVQKVMEGEVATKGGRLVINKLWSDATVNAQAYRQGQNFMVDMFGGLARHPAITSDGLAMVACHEIGHHIGGAPKFSDQNASWASDEGEADYYSTAKCLRKLWAGENNAIANEDPEARRRCNLTWANDVAAANMCVRISMAGMSGSQLFFQMGGTGRAPSFSMPDSSVVQRTNDAHPQYQCRLDTYFNGALCTIAATVDIGNQDPEIGACTIAKGLKEGVRPACWYKSSGGGGNPPNDIALNPLINGQMNLRSANPYLPITIAYDVSNFAGGAGAYVEISRPNSTFSNPNDTKPDPFAQGGVQIRGVRGWLTLTPSVNLPSWGVYSIRVVPLDISGRNAVGHFSNASIFSLLPGAVPLYKRVETQDQKQSKILDY